MLAVTTCPAAAPVFRVAFSTCIGDVPKCKRQWVLRGVQDPAVAIDGMRAVLNDLWEIKDVALYFRFKD